MRYFEVLGVGLGVLFGGVFFISEAVIDIYGSGRVVSIAVRSLLLIMSGFLGYRIGSSYRQLRRLCITDPLTGAYNRKYFFDQFRKHLVLASRHGHEVAVVMFDVDNFKDYNDTRGHLAGDRFLQEIADIMKRNIRGSDILARYGGEEFALCLPYAGADGAMAMAERIRKLVGRLTNPSLGGCPVTISAGIAVFPHDGRSVEELVHRADMALYEAKKQRNAVIYF